MVSSNINIEVELEEIKVLDNFIEEKISGDILKEIQAKEELLRNLDLDIYDYLAQRVVPERESVHLIDSKDVKDLKTSEGRFVTTVVNLCKVNDFRFINKYFIEVNKVLPDAGRYLGCVETIDQRKEGLFHGKNNIFLKLYWLYCFIVHRVFPKTSFFKKIYYAISKGRYRWVSKAEVLGRLISCGFEIIEYKEIGNKIYFNVLKTGDPSTKKPSFGPVFPMRRVGKNGELIKVYKVRTMHPYSEYLQDFVVKLNGYNDVGKPANDFRLTGWGKVFRKYWLDEIPQFLNVIKGEIGLVGVRPLSVTRFNELPKDVQEQRVKFKPGCIPPYVSLNMPDEQGNIEAERIYMEERLKNGFRTDIKYLFLALYNIFTGKIKSS